MTDDLFRLLRARLDAEGRIDLAAVVTTCAGFYAHGRVLPRAALDAMREANTTGLQSALDEWAMLQEGAAMAEHVLRIQAGDTVRVITDGATGTGLRISRPPRPEGSLEYVIEIAARKQGRRRVLTHAGRSLTASAWARELGLKRGTLHKRLASGWSVEKALTTPEDDW